jgi:hypothetical protein
VSLVNTSPRLTSLHLVGTLTHLTDEVFSSIDEHVYGQLREITLANCKSISNDTIDMILLRCHNLTKVDVSLTIQTAPSWMHNGFGAIPRPPPLDSVMTEKSIIQIMKNNPELKQIKFRLSKISETFFDYFILNDTHILTDVCLTFQNVSATANYLRQVITFLLKCNTIQYAKITFCDYTTVKVFTDKVTQVCLFYT